MILYAAQRFVIISGIITLSGIWADARQTYYVDCTDGNDTRAGTSIATAWKHCPGDSSSQGSASTTNLQPGDSVIFKGGITYRGGVGINRSGDAGVVFVNRLFQLRPSARIGLGYGRIRVSRWFPGHPFPQYQTYTITTGNLPTGCDIHLHICQNITTTGADYCHPVREIGFSQHIDRRDQCR